MQDKIDKIKAAFSKLSFVEDTHSYYVDGKRLSTSTSGLIKNLTSFVDFSSIAKSIDIKKELPVGSTKKLWDLKSEAACAVGSKAHYFGELYAFHRNIRPETGYEEAITKWWRSLPKHIIPVFTELEMYHFNNMFGGTADIILYNTISEKFIIADYKTNEDLWKNFKGKTLLAPFDFLLEDAFNKYKIQFSIYQILFEQTGFEVENRCLVWIKPDGTFKQFFTEDYTDILKDYLNTL